MLKTVLSYFATLSSGLLSGYFLFTSQNNDYQAVEITGLEVDHTIVQEKLDALNALISSQKHDLEEQVTVEPVEYSMINTAYEH